MKAFHSSHTDNSYYPIISGKDAWESCSQIVEQAGQWTSCCFITVQEELLTNVTLYTFSMSFHVNVQVVFSIKVLLTCLTIINLQIGYFFTDIFQRWYIFGCQNVRKYYFLKLRKLWTFVSCVSSGHCQIWRHFHKDHTWMHLLPAVAVPPQDQHLFRETRVQDFASFPRRPPSAWHFSWA